MTDAAFTAFADAARARIDVALRHYLPQPPACPPLLADAMRYSVMAGGKRLRPLITLAAAHTVAAGAPPAHRQTAGAPATTAPAALDEAVTQLALPAACALEFIHTYSLIHDDLPAMDNDALRRGRPTLHVVYSDAVAILAGDALQAEAFALVAREPATDTAHLQARKLAALAVLSEAAGAAGMVGGQTVDIQAAGQVDGHHIALDLDGLAAMHQQKTGALIRAAAACGAIMAGADSTVCAAVTDWGRHIGLAFQIVDDILDVEGDSADLGKTAGKDAAADKPTYPALVGIDRARRMADDCAAEAAASLRRAHLSGEWLDAVARAAVTRRA